MNSKLLDFKHLFWKQKMQHLISYDDANKMEVSLKLRADDKDINHLNMTQNFSFISQVFQPKFESLHNNFLIPANVPFTTNAISGHQLLKVFMQ